MGGKRAARGGVEIGEGDNVGMIARSNPMLPATRDLAVRRPESARERLRALLARSGVRREFGARPESLLRRLRTVLAARRDDARFWARLARLVSEQVDFPVSADPFELDLTRGRVLEGLLLDLRDSLRPGASHEPGEPWLPGGLSDPGKLAFYLLASAAGPSEDEASGPGVDPWRRRLFAIACASGLEYESSAILALFCLRAVPGLRRRLDSGAPWTLPDLSRAVAWLAGSGRSNA